MSIVPNSFPKYNEQEFNLDWLALKFIRILLNMVFNSGLCYFSAYNAFFNLANFIAFLKFS